MAVARYAFIETPLGRIVVVADEQQLYYLQFEDKVVLPDLVAQLSKAVGYEIREGSTPVLDQLSQELQLYFAGKLQVFKTPLFFFGTNFQKSVWQQLTTIPCGNTISYKALATGVGLPTGYRAAANANGANNFVIVVPCHRVIAHDGSLGGYSSGIERKKWLLDHEKRVSNFI